jgi:hypothetical protein
MRGKHTCKTLHVATLLSKPAGGAVVLASDDGAGEHQRQDVPWYTSSQQEQTPAPVPASQVPSLPPCPTPYFPLLGRQRPFWSWRVD